MILTILTHLLAAMFGASVTFVVIAMLMSSDSGDDEADNEMNENV